VFGQALKKKRMGSRQVGHMLVSIILKETGGGGKKSLDLEVSSPVIHGLLRRGIVGIAGGKSGM